MKVTGYNAPLIINFNLFPFQSGNSSLHDRVNITKQKVTSTRSNTVIINSNKSSTSDFLKKNCTALKRYSKFFAEKASVHIGHPETHFKKSLRRYDVFSFDRNTAWIKVKDPHPCGKKPHFHPVEYLLEVSFIISILVYKL